MNEYGIKNEIYLEIINLFKKLDYVKKVILFGSRAKKIYKETSDIDLAVELLDNYKKLELIRKLEELRCALKFDVIDINKIENNKLLERINQEGIIIYEKNK